MLLEKFFVHSKAILLDFSIILSIYWVTGCVFRIRKREMRRSERENTLKMSKMRKILVLREKIKKNIKEERF